MRVHPQFIDLLDDSIGACTGYRPGQCFTVMMGLFLNTSDAVQQELIHRASQLAHQFEDRKSYDLIPIQVHTSSKSMLLFRQNSDKIVMIAVLLFHGMIEDKKGGSVGGR